MNKKLLKIFSVILTFATVIGCFAFSVNATTQTGKINTLSYKIVNGEATITKCDNTENVSIPNEIEECKVTAIGSFAFENCTNLKKVTVPDNVKSIGICAFSSCIALSSVIFNEGLQSIGISAFEYCTSLKSLTLPSSLKAINGWAFEGCKNLEMIVFNEALETIGEWAFKDCEKISAIQIPQNVKKIGERAFGGCLSIQSFSVIGSNKYYSSDFSGILYNKDQTALIAYPLGRASNYCSLPSSLISITKYAFYKCKNIETVVFKDNIKEIGDFAFAMCENLSSVKLTKNLETIGQNAFYGCEMLSNIDLPASLKTIGKYAFYSCNSLKTVDIKENFQSIGEYALSNCGKIEKITVSAANESFASDENGVLYSKDFSKLILFPAGSPLTEYSIVGSTTALGELAFYNAKKLTSITVSKELRDIPDYSIGYIFDEATGTKIINQNLTFKCYKNSPFFTYASDKKLKMNFLNDAVITKLELNDITVKSGESKSLTPVIETNGELMYKCEYLSSDSSIAAIENGNRVKGVKFGDTTITLIVTDENGNKYVDTCICKVQRGTLEMITYILAFGWLADIFKK